MRTFVLCLLIACGTSVVLADAPAFVYNDHDKRDPFLPQVSAAGAVLTYETDLTANDMVLEGIVADAQGNNVAVINGKVIKKGDAIGLYTVAAVGVQDVELTKGEEHFTVKLKKGNM